MIVSDKIKIVCVGCNEDVLCQLEDLIGSAKFDFSPENSILKTRSEVFSRISNGSCDVLILPIAWTKPSSVDLAIRARTKSNKLTIIGFHSRSLEEELVEAMESVVDEYWDTRSLSDFDMVQSLVLASERRALLCELANELEASKNQDNPNDQLTGIKREKPHKPESVGDLTGGLAHNLNNLMMGVLGNAELLKSDFELDNMTLDRLKKLESSAQKASDLCQRLLSFSGQGNLAVQPFDLAKLLDELKGQLSDKLPNGTSIQYSISRGLPFMHGDPAEIRQLIINLALNAAEAIDKEGSVSVSCGMCNLSEKEIAEMLVPCEFDSGEYLYLEIEDDGIGIGSSSMNKIFEPFFTTKSDGRGLGLPASLGIVKAHYGVLDVSSGEGGTSVKVFFPAGRHKKGNDVLEPKKQKDDSEMKKVLVVDDEDVLRMVVSSLLKLFGYEPITASNGEDAFDLYLEDKGVWAFAMIDLNMPGMSGADLFSKMKNENSGLPILVMSGDGEEPEVLQELLTTSSSCGYLMKPFGMEDLKTAISELVELPIV